MNDINYTCIDFNRFVFQLKKLFDTGDYTVLQMQSAAGNVSASSIYNLFKPGSQQVSDEVLSKVAAALKMDCYIVWNNGERKYYVRKKQNLVTNAAFSTTAANG